MPNVVQHLNQFKHNNKTLCLLCEVCNDKTWDWKVTICYYAALHLIHAHLAKHDSHPETHGSVKRAINPLKNSRSKVSYKAWENYTELEFICNSCRYLDNSVSFRGVTKKCFTDALVHYDIILSEYNVMYPNEISGFKVTIDYAPQMPLKFIQLVKAMEKSPH